MRCLMCLDRISRCKCTATSKNKQLKLTLGKSNSIKEQNRKRKWMAKNTDQCVPKKLQQRGMQQQTIIASSSSLEGKRPSKAMV